MEYGDILLRDGVVVIPAFSEQDTLMYNLAFWQAVRSFPEYINPGDPSTVFVQGAFGALGNPASFHNPVVRHIRINMMFRAVPLFKAISSNMKLEQLMDRMSIRRQGTSLGKESWHRDQAESLPEDYIFGGWVNFDTQNDQKFSCIPGSHIIRKDASGFVRETSVDESQKRIFTIPPGYWIIFFQNILHEVLPGKVRHETIRLYLGWRLTYADIPLYDQTIALRDQGIPKGPSGQIATMYYQNHLSFHAQNTISWSKNTFKEQCLEEKNTPKLGKFTVVHKIMRSLKEYQLPLYEEYSEEDKSLLTPRRNWIFFGQELSM